MQMQLFFLRIQTGLWAAVSSVKKRLNLTFLLFGEVNVAGQKASASTSCSSQGVQVQSWLYEDWAYLHSRMLSGEIYELRITQSKDRACM